MHAARAISIQQQINSPEGIALLKKINEQVYENLHVLEKALDPYTLIESIRSLSEADFYKNVITKKSAEKTLLSEQAAAAPSMVNIGKGLSLKAIKPKVVAATNGATDTVDAEIDAAVAGSPVAQDQSWWSYIVKLGSALTEGYTGWGVLHLILDVIGVAGDYLVPLTLGIPTGVIADTINAVLYFWRGKGLLGVISLVAAFIPYGGDIIKGFKPFIKGLIPAWGKVATKGAGRKITKESVKVLSKADPKTFVKMSRFLGFLKKSVSSIAGKLGKVMEYITRNVFGTIAGWIPFAGKPLKKLAGKMADSIKNVSDNLLTFSKSYGPELQKAMTKRADETFKALDKVPWTRGGRVVKDGKNLVIKNRGKIVKTIPIDEFVKYSQVVKKYPTGPLAKFFKESDKVADFYTYLARSGAYSAEFLAKYGKKSILAKASLKLPAFGLFIMKQMLKLFGQQGDAMSDFEKKQMANIVTTSQLHKIIESDQKRERDKLGSVVAVPFRDLFSGHEGEEGDVAIALQKHLNYNAKRMGMPNLQTYFAAQAKWNKEKAIEKLYSGFITQEEYDKLANTIDTKDAKMKADSIDTSPQPDSFDDTPNVKESVSYERMKYIKEFKAI